MPRNAMVLQEISTYVLPTELSNWAAPKQPGAGLFCDLHVVCRHMRTCVTPHVCPSACTSMLGCVYVRVRAYTRVCVCVCVYVCMCVCVPGVCASVCVCPRTANCTQYVHSTPLAYRQPTKQCACVAVCVCPVSLSRPLLYLSLVFCLSLCYSLSLLLPLSVYLSHSDPLSLPLSIL